MNNFYTTIDYSVMKVFYIVDDYVNTCFGFKGKESQFREKGEQTIELLFIFCDNNFPAASPSSVSLFHFFRLYLAGTRRQKIFPVVKKTS
jgi:hypothetical protein